MSATDPAIFVAVPFHSNLAYLDQALRSLVDQTDGQWSAAVVEDATAEPGANAVVERLGDPRLVHLHDEVELGVAEMFNRCLEVSAASGGIVAIMHADDVLERGFIAAIRQAHRDFPDAAIVATRASVIDAEGHQARNLTDLVKQAMWPRRLPMTLTGDRGLARLLHGLFLYCPAVSYRVERLGDMRFDPRWQQVMDLDLFSRVLLGGEDLALVPDRVYRYRRHADSLSAAHTRSGVRHAEEVAVTKEIVVEARRRGWRRSVRAGKLRLTVRINALLSRLASAVGRG